MGSAEPHQRASARGGIGPIGRIGRIGPIGRASAPHSFLSGLIWNNRDPVSGGSSRLLLLLKLFERSRASRRQFRQEADAGPRTAALTAF